MVTMLLLTLLAVNLATACIAGVPGDNSHYKEGDRFIWFPDGDDNPVLADLFEEVVPESPASRRGARNSYNLYTRANPSTPQQLFLDDNVTLGNSHFDVNKVTKLLIHGWQSSASSNLNKLVQPALLEEGDYNVIVVDWGHSANSGYVTCVNRVPNIGQYVGLFLEFLHQNGVPYSNMHIVGHSLGAHISGVAGRLVNGQVGRITGLDPAGPLWPGNSDRIVPTDAQFVEIIHTDSGWLGFWDPCGHADFYPNGGHSQPGCWLSTCHHSRAYEFYAATVRYNHLVGNECSDVNEATGRNGCSGQKTEFMGNASLRKSNQGIFRMETGRRYPYSA